MAEIQYFLRCLFSFLFIVGILLADGIGVRDYSISSYMENFPFRDLWSIMISNVML